MRIITWNCHHGQLNERCRVLDCLAPDICVIQECGPSSESSNSELWFKNHHATQQAKGIGIQVRHGYQLQSGSIIEACRDSACPVIVRTPTGTQLHVLAICTDESPSYVKCLDRALNEYRAFLSDALAIVVGDFNIDMLVDAPNATRSHANLVARLRDEFRLVNAYHALNALTSARTYYHNYKRDQPFHIDYCFVPIEWSSKIQSAEIGKVDDWISESDHMPLTVTVDLERAA